VVGYSDQRGAGSDGAQDAEGKAVGCREGKSGHMRKNRVRGGAHMSAANQAIGFGWVLSGLQVVGHRDNRKENEH
jgi:hypothetical protein